MKKSTQADQIKAFILKHVGAHPADIAAWTAGYFKVTRTTVHRHLNTLLRKNHIVKSGVTRDCKYFASTSFNREVSYKIHPSLSEFDIFEKNFKAVFSELPQNIYNICSYGFTEMVNNAMEHSKGSKLSIHSTLENNTLIISIKDNGIGIFNNISHYFKLKDVRESIIQLNKGKMTTDPSNHSGEGIFFTSRVFDRFEIYSNGLYFIRDNQENDWSVQKIHQKTPGTCIQLTINIDSTQNLLDVFKKFQDDDLSFDRTEIIVDLARISDEILMSRSQAKRILLGLEKFKRVTLDFRGIQLIGQGFVDEVFRVYANAHPDLVIDYMNANEDVLFMIKRGLATSRIGM